MLNTHTDRLLPSILQFGIYLPPQAGIHVSGRCKSNVTKDASLKSGCYVGKQKQMFKHLHSQHLTLHHKRILSC